MSMFKDLNVVYYYVKDWEGAKKFYTEVLDWPVAWASDEMGWLEFGREGETHLAINRWDRDDPLPTKGAIATFTVEDAEKVTAALRAKGVKCDDVVTIPDTVTLGTFYDPEGNRFQFAESAD